MIGRTKTHQLLVASAIVGSLAWHSAGYAQDTQPAPAGPTAPSAPNAVEGANTPAIVDNQAVTANDIIVTATKRTERLENVPATIVAVTGQALQTAGVVRFSEISMVAPGVMVSRSGTYTQPSIRGVSTSFAGGGQEVNVALYIDGFYQSDQTGMNQDLSNIQGIEILKGPQGTLYGRNATGGAILITTRSPTDKWQVEANASYAWRFNDKIGNFFAGGPIANGVKISVAASWHKGDGYIKDINGFADKVTLDSTNYCWGDRSQSGNPCRANLQYAKLEKRGGKNVIPVLNWSVRPKLVLEPFDNLKVTFGYVHTFVSENKSQAYLMTTNRPNLNDPVQGHLGFDQFGNDCVPDGSGTNCYETATVGTTGKFKTSLNFRPINETKQDEGNMTIAWKMGDLGTLTSRTAFRHQTDLNVYELDGTARNPSQSGTSAAVAGGAVSFASIGFNNRHTFTQQLDYSGEFGPLSLLAGFFLYKDQFKSKTSNDVGTGSNPTLSFTNFKTTAWGAFIDETYNINDKLFINAGIRYNYDRKSLAVIQYSQDPSKPDASHGGVPTGIETLSGGRALNNTACMTGAFGSTDNVVGNYDPAATIDSNGIAHCHLGRFKHVTGKAWTPHVVIRYNLSRGTNIYASWSRGFKSATINSGSPFNALKPEKVTAWEVGIKTNRGGFRGEASAFYYDYKNNQISAFNGTTTVTNNSGGAKVYGLDLSLQYKVPDMPLNLRGSMEYLHARYTKFSKAANVTSTSGLTTCVDAVLANCTKIAGRGDALGQNTSVYGNWTGRRLLRAPDWTASIGADYTLEGIFGGKAVISMTAQYSSKYAPQNASYWCEYHTASASPRPPEIQGPNEIPGLNYCNVNQPHKGKGRFEENGWAQVNAQINWTDASDHYSIGVFGNNINNVHYFLAYSQPGYGKNIVYNEPRTFGVRVGVKF